MNKVSELVQTRFPKDLPKEVDELVKEQLEIRSIVIREAVRQYIRKEKLSRIGLPNPLNTHGGKRLRKLRWFMR